MKYDFKVIELICCNKRVVWEYIGEGEDGDFNDDNKHDVRLLRFSCDRMVEPDPMAQFGGLGGWEGMEDASYCTLMPVDTSMKILVAGLGKIMEAIVDEDDESTDYKRKLEALSWMKPQDFNKE